MHVMAGVMLDASGRVLLAQRPPGKHLAGLWEFPGGKIDPGEVPLAALVRELREELGVDVDAATAVPLIRIPWRYGDRDLLLDAWQIDRWQGQPLSLEGQAWQWIAPDHVDPAILAPADRPILQALRLPSRYPITPADVELSAYPLWLARLSQAIERGERLLQLRLPLWPVESVRELASALLPLARRCGASLLLNGDIEGARQLGLGVGVQLQTRQCRELSERPLPLTQLVGVSCHNEAELVQASRLQADFAMLSPVAVTASHPDVPPLGWSRFGQLVERAALPVYALGGMMPVDGDRARDAGGQGVAGIRGFW
ncbi:Nudix family hydrolase [Dyella tabacisoli]|uniref:8-oxo-dGTP diphosphatase n=2 Tax=Dyella tabacisoli TaxID=2282381 RepID=A0A369USQ0_9GAMM|nr:Nudix family hydrolase [Dyella tabacisoli]